MGRPRKKQPDLPAMDGPGVERPSHPDIDEAAADYVRKRDARVARTPPEVEAKAALLAAMHAHELVEYEYVDGDEVMVVKVKTSDETVVVKAKPAHEEAEDVEVAGNE